MKHSDDYEGNIDLNRVWEGVVGGKYRYFFEGPVKILGPGSNRSGGFFSSKETMRYSIDYSSSNIIDIDLDTHVRLIPHNYQSLFNIVGSTLNDGTQISHDSIDINFGEHEGLQYGQCKVLAPIKNLNIVSGDIPFKYVSGHTDQYYISQRNHYQNISNF
jgi:hypothetical protein